MPNWCQNSMKITGAAEEIARFKQTCIIDGELDFNAVIPMPENVRDGKGVDGPRTDAQDAWAWEHWGVRWSTGRDFCLIEDGADCLKCSFFTAWSPPIPVWAKTCGLEHGRSQNRAEGKRHLGRDLPHNIRNHCGTGVSCIA